MLALGILPVLLPNRQDLLCLFLRHSARGLCGLVLFIFSLVSLHYWLSFGSLRTGIASLASCGAYSWWLLLLKCHYCAALIFGGGSY